MLTSRRRFLTLLGLTPALPLLGKVPLVDSHIAELPVDVPLRNNSIYVSGHGISVASGGLCAPITPLYDLPSGRSPVRDALPTVRAGR